MSEIEFRVKPDNSTDFGRWHKENSKSPQNPVWIANLLKDASDPPTSLTLNYPDGGQVEYRLTVCSECGKPL